MVIDVDYKELAETLKKWEEHSSFRMCMDWSLFCLENCNKSKE